MTDEAAPGRPYVSDAARAPAWRAALRPAAWIAASGCLILLGHAFVILGGPLHTTDMAHDTFIFIDAAHRVQSGLIPHLDFVTALGALNFYGPALWGLIDDPFRSFALFHILVLAVVLALASWAAITRGLDTFAGVVLVVYLGAAVGAPSNLGDPPGTLTFAMWYNRVSWGLLLVGLVLFVEPRRRGSAAIAVGDGLLILAIGLVTFYLKVTFAAVAAALFVFGLAAKPHLRRPALVAAGGALCTLLGIELATGGLNTAYLRDLLDIAAIDGPSLLDATRLLPMYPAPIYECAVAAAAALIFGMTRKGASRSDLVLVLMVAAFSNFLYSTNAQLSGLVTLFAVPLLAYARAASRPAPRRWTPAALAALALAFAAPELVGRYGSLVDYASRDLEAGYPYPAPARLADGLLVGDVYPAATHRFLARLEAGEPRSLVMAERAANERPGWAPLGASQAEYVYLIARGAFRLQEVIRRSGSGQGPVVVLDFANPISAILDLPPARGDYAWFHLGRNIDAGQSPAPTELLANARYVMAPKFSTNPPTVEFLVLTYEPFLAAHYDVVHDDPLWRIWARRAPAAG